MDKDHATHTHTLAKDVTYFRFSDHPSIRTDPPYLACERFAKKALSLVDASTLQPTMSNIQFWGIMSFVEYGRASGSM